MTESPVKARRYVQSDIDKILNLARTACAGANVPYDEKRLKFVLDNNLKNAFFCCLVLVDLAEIVGVLISTVKKNVLNENMAAVSDLFYFGNEYADQINLIMGEYTTWARDRECREARTINQFVPAITLQDPKFLTHVEVI